MIAWLIFFFHLSVTLAVWWVTTNHNKKDFAFLVIGLVFATQICDFFGSVWMVRLRHALIPLLLIALGFRWRFLRGNMGILAKLYLLIVLLVFVSSLWSSDVKGFLGLKFKMTLINIVFVLVASTFRSADDLKKCIYSALPQIALMAFGFVMGVSEYGEIGNERLSINDVNSNGIGAMSAFVVLCCVITLLYLKNKFIVKILFTACFLVGLRSLINSGSRTAFAACAGAVMILMAVVLTSKKRFWKIGVPFAIVAGAMFWRVWSHSSYSVTERFAEIATGGTSGRDQVWEMAFYHLLDNGLWFGDGGLIQGFFVKRVDFMYQGLYRGSLLNYYFDTIYETGIFGLVLWVLFLVAFFWLSFVNVRKTISPWRFVPIAMCIWGLLQSCGESMAGSAFHPVGAFMVIGMCTLSAKKFNYNDISDTPNLNKRRIIWS